jgi:hypothetical protein
MPVSAVVVSARSAATLSYTGMTGLPSAVPSLRYRIYPVTAAEPPSVTGAVQASVTVVVVCKLKCRAVGATGTIGVVE